MHIYIFIYTYIHTFHSRHGITMGWLLTWIGSLLYKNMVYIYIYIYTYTYIHIHTFMQTRSLRLKLTWLGRPSCIRARHKCGSWVCPCTCMHIISDVWVHVPCVYTYIYHVCIHACTMCVYIHASCVYIYMYHACIHTPTQVPRPSTMCTHTI